IALTFAMLLASVSPAAGAAPRPRAEASEQAVPAAVYTLGRGAARLSLAEPRELSAFAPLGKQSHVGRSLAAGDFDGDGRTDLVEGYATGLRGLVTVARGDDGGSFGEPRDFELPAAADLLVAGDFDGDSRDD